MVAVRPLPTSPSKSGVQRKRVKAAEGKVTRKAERPIPALESVGRSTKRGHRPAWSISRREATAIYKGEVSIWVGVVSGSVALLVSAVVLPIALTATIVWSICRGSTVVFAARISVARLWSSACRVATLATTRVG